MSSESGDGTTAPDVVDQYAHDLFDQVGQLIGDRLAERRFDDDRGLRFTITDLSEDDVAAITDLARQLGIADWVRIERANPADLENWERLRHDLLRLQEAESRVLTQWSTPDPGYRRPPVAIVLSANGESTAADLHERYGDFVALKVGALPYPPRPDRPGRDHRSTGLDIVSAAEMRIVLDGPLRLRTGETATHAIMLTNLSDEEISVHTNGALTANVVDESGSVIGGYAGFQITPLVNFAAAPSDSLRIPVLVGTDSFSTALGYAVPSGQWHLSAPMLLGDGRELLTPALELTITE